MFVLVYFPDGEYFICSEKNISKRNGSICNVKFTNKKYYEAAIIAFHESKEVLNLISTNLVNAVPRIGLFRIDLRNLNKSNQWLQKELEKTRKVKEIESEFSTLHNDLVQFELHNNPEQDTEFDYITDDNSIIDPDYIPESDEKEAKIRKLIGQSSQENALKEINWNCRENFIDSVEIINKEHSTDLEHSHSDNINPTYVPKSTENGSKNGEDDSEVIEDIHTSSRDVCDVTSPAILSSNRNKKYFCFYCKKLICKFARHLEMVHKNEKEVQILNSFPKGSKERLQTISKLRKKGCFLFNTNRKYNKGYLILTRQPHDKFNRTDGDFKVCPECNGFYSKNSARRHYLICGKEVQKGDRNLSELSNRAHKRIHRKANDVLKNKIFPVFQNDLVINKIRYDELVVIYGNMLTVKYRDQHHYPMIRSRLRLIGRFLIEITKINKEIKDFASIFQPIHYDSVIAAVNKVANFNGNSLKYKSPATAFSLGTLLKKTGKILVNEYIKMNDAAKQKNVENFLHVLEEDFNYSVNKTVTENQLEMKRSKKIILPSQNDIILLNKYLKEHRQHYFNILKESFSFVTWKKLSEYTLISAQIFNRRRPGEIERILISDFNKYESIDENTDHDIFAALSEDAKKSARQYVRFTIRGKLARGVAVLLHKELLTSVKLIVHYRKEAGVADDNPYVFGLPGCKVSSKVETFKHLRACNLLRKFSEECGAKNASVLRATELRKHIATRSVLLNLENNEVSDLARHLGHEKKIHEDHYQIPIVTRDLARMSRLLEIAQGEGEEEDVSENPIIQLSHSNEEILKKKLTLNSPDRRKRSSSPRGTVKRVSWQNEKELVTTLFKQHIDNGTLPSLSYCQEVIGEHSELQNRSPVQLKSWISNQIQSKSSPKEVKTKRKRENTIYWTSEEKNIMRNFFIDNLRDEKLPDFKKCEEAIKTFPELALRSKETIKAWVYSEIRRNKRNKI